MTSQACPGFNVDEINKKVECCINELKKQPNIQPATQSVLQQFHQKVQEARTKLNDPKLAILVVTELEQAADSAVAALKADPNVPQNCVACAEKLEKCLDNFKNKCKQHLQQQGQAGQTGAQTGGVAAKTSIGEQAGQGQFGQQAGMAGRQQTGA